MGSSARAHAQRPRCVPLHASRLMPVDGPAAGRPSVYRNVPGNSLWTVCAGGASAIALGEGLVEPSVPTRVAFFLASLVLAWLTVRVIRSGIVVSQTGVEVRGWTRTRTAPWTDIACFEPIPGSPINRSVYLAVRLKDGRHLATGGLGMNKLGAYAKSVLAELEAHRPQD